MIRPSPPTKPALTPQARPARWAGPGDIAVAASATITPAVSASMSTVSTCVLRAAMPARKSPLPYSKAAASPRRITTTCTSDRPGRLRASGTCSSLVTSKSILEVTTRPVKPFRQSRCGTLLVMTVPSWVPNEEIKPAPMPLLLVQSFVNTWDGDRGSDLLLDPAAARDWMTQAGLWSAERAPDPAELHLARGVREAIRAMLVANSGGPRPGPSELQPLQSLVLGSPPAPRGSPEGPINLSPQPAD